MRSAHLSFKIVILLLEDDVGLTLVLHFLLQCFDITEQRSLLGLSIYKHDTSYCIHVMYTYKYGRTGLYKIVMKLHYM